MENKTILFVDLDGTLINTISGKIFPEHIFDFKINKELLDNIKIKLPKIEYLCVVSNQGGIEEGYVEDKEFRSKILAIFHLIDYYMKDDYDLTIGFRYCSNDKQNNFRKPNTAMLIDFLEKETKYTDGKWNREKYTMLMIGDASGKEGQFSDSDKKCAENFGIDYIDVEDFINE